jgi:hypothetical protein
MNTPVGGCSISLKLPESSSKKIVKPLVTYEQVAIRQRVPTFLSLVKDRAKALYSISSPWLSPGAGVGGGVGGVGGGVGGVGVGIGVGFVDISSPV